MDSSGAGFFREDAPQATSVDVDTELSLVGMMTDEADVRHEEGTGVVEIKLLRKK